MTTRLNKTQLNKLVKNHPFKLIISSNGFRVSIGHNTLRHSRRYLISMGPNDTTGSWHNALVKIRSKLLNAIDSNNDNAAKKYLKYMNIVCDHQRTTNNANGMGKDVWKMVTMTEVLEKLDTLRSTVNKV